MNELTSLQQALSSGNVTQEMTSDIINQLLGWAIIPSIVFLALLLALYIIRSAHRHKVDKAVFEIRDMLREMRLENSSVNTPPVKPDELK